jgi:magnesium transporter
MTPNWIDLLDPTKEELKSKVPFPLQESAYRLLLAKPVHEDEPRPTIQSHGTYVFGVFLVAIAIPESDEMCYQEVELVVAPGTIVTVRKTPPHDKAPYDLESVRSSVRDTDSAGMIGYRIVDDIAERYLDLVDAIDAEIDELEDKVDLQRAETTRRRISELRHDLLRIRRTLAPTRDAVRRVVDGTIEVERGEEVFPHDAEIAFQSTYDKLLRAFDGLEFSRDLLASVRDYAQAKIAIDQNDVTKRLTVGASLILVPTFIVGVYGQNFIRMPELHWHYGYAYSWALIIATTVIQLIWFRRKHWI